MPGSHHLWATFVWLIEIQVHCKNQSSSSVLEIYTVIDGVYHSLCGALSLDPVTRLHAVGGRRPIKQGDQLRY